MAARHDDFSLRERLEVLGRSKWLLGVFCLSAVGSSLALTYIYAERYRAVATLIYRPTESIRFQSREKQSLGFPVPMLPFEVIGHTIGQVGTSEPILREVVERLGLDKKVEKERTGWSKLYHNTKTWLKDRISDIKQIAKYGRTIERNPTSAAIEELAGNVTIETTRKDYTALIEVVDKDPARAAAIVDEIGDILVHFFREEIVHSARQKREELERQLAETKSDIDAARHEMELLKTGFQFTELDEEISLKLRRVDDLEGKVADAEADIRETSARLETLAVQRDSLKRMIVSSLTVEDDPLYKKLEDMQSDREISRRGLLQRFPADHIDVLTLNAELEAIDRSLGGLEKTRVSRWASEINEVYVKVLADQQNAAATLAGYKAARDSLEQELTAIRNRLLDPSIRTRHNNLQLQLEVLERTFSQLSEAHAESRIAELKSASEVRMLHKATPQELPFRPIKIYHVLVAGILALIAGTGYIYFLDFWRSLMSRGDREMAG